MVMDTTFSHTSSRAEEEELLERVRKLSIWLDKSFNIPFTKFKIGMEGIIGLIPGIGDAAGTVFSSYIIYQAIRLGIPKPVLAKMGMNVAIDFLVGSVPILGDVFDVAFKANIKNVALMEEYMRTRHQRPTPVG